MDQGTLVENRVPDGRRFLERFAADGNPVLAAFWVRTAEEGLWFLYVVTELVDREGPAATYRAVHESLRKLEDSSISSSEIKVIGPKNPVAKDVLAMMARRPIPIATGDAVLGGMAVEKMILYGPRVYTFNQANPMTTEEVGREILRLMNRDADILQPARVTLKDGTAFNGLPFSFQLGSENAVVVSFIADGELVPRVVRLDEIASII